MALGFGAAKGEEDVIALITKKNYAKAIEVLKRGKADARAKMQLADVLVLAGKPREAVAILAPLADEYAREGFAAKAISVLKKIQKIDPSRRDTEQKLASLIQEKQRVATVSLPTSSPSPGGFEIGIEEIGMEPPPGLGGGPSGAPGLELGFGMEAGPELETAPPPPAPDPLPLAAPPSLPSPETVAPPPPPPPPLVEPFTLELDPPQAAPVPPPPPAAPPPPAPLAGIPDVIPAASKAVPLVDTDFFTEEDLSLGEPEASLSAEPIVEAEVAVEAEIVGEPAAAPDPMSDARFADELMGLVDSLFDSSATTGAATAEAPEAGQQIVVSPLFAALSVDEMVAVIAGLNLLTFDRGDVIIRQGQPGNSLYMLTSGKVRAFVKKDGKNVPVADLSEGAFFGEGSILTGKPRSATVAALTSCELLELDRPTLDEITSRHPHVMDVMREFAARRLK